MARRINSAISGTVKLAQADNPLTSWLGYDY